MQIFIHTFINTNIQGDNHVNDQYFVTRSLGERAPDSRYDVIDTFKMYEYNIIYILRRLPLYK